MIWVLSYMQHRISGKIALLFSTRRPLLLFPLSSVQKKVIPSGNPKCLSRANENKFKKKKPNVWQPAATTRTSNWSLLPQVIFRSAFNPLFSYFQKPASAGVVDRRGKTDGNYFFAGISQKNFQVLPGGGYVLYRILLSRSFWKNIIKGEEGNGIKT